MTMYFESYYDKHLREQRAGNVVKDYGILDRPKVVGVSADDLLNTRDTIINVIIKKQEMELLHHCRHQFGDIITMIDVANTTDDLNLELLKVLVGDIKNVFGCGVE